MKKKTLTNVLLILLPVMAAVFASTADSVTVFDAAAGTVLSYSYFSLIPNVTGQMLPPLAGALCVAAAILAVITVAGKKTGCGRWLKWLSFAAAAAAVVPILLRDEALLVVPNVLLPLLMMVEYVLAGQTLKALANPAKDSDRPAGERLR